jgi:hypothetical protein
MIIEKRACNGFEKAMLFGIAKELSCKKDSPFTECT